MNFEPFIIWWLIGLVFAVMTFRNSRWSNDTNCYGRPYEKKVRYNPTYLGLFLILVGACLGPAMIFGALPTYFEYTIKKPPAPKKARWYKRRISFPKLQVRIDWND